MTPRMSVRARAREIYGEMAPASLRYAGQGEAVPPQSGAAPTPNPSPHSSPDGERPLAYGGGEQAEQAARAEPDLNARVRALYENSAVPVREIAALAGVTERTIYKYAARGAWKPRYRWAPDGKRPAAFAPVKGAGGRFIRREDKDLPFARGLKSTDPSGRARALAACLKATRLSRAAQATAAQEARDAQAHRRFETRLRVISVTNRAFADLNAFRKVHAASLRRYAAHLAQQEAAKAPGDEPSKHIGKEPTNGRWPLALIARAERLHMQAVETALRLWRALPE